MNAYRDQERFDGEVPTIVSNNSNFVKGGPGEPVLVSWADVVMVCTASLVICFLATIYPSWEACRMPPLDAIRYD